jgi:uncharacterized membrane protein AbrB (regulator of aidB expression)
VGGVVKAGWFPPVAWGWLLITLSLAIGTAFFAHWLRVFTGPMLVTLLSAIVLQGLGWIKIELPPWLLAVSYAIVGWTVGRDADRADAFALDSAPRGRGPAARGVGSRPDGGRFR